MKRAPAAPALALAVLLAACGQGAAPPPSAAPPPAGLKAPAGDYKLDPNHASLAFKVRHLGLADYHARFTKFDVALSLDPQAPGNSSVTVTVDPTSVRTDYPGDFRATHKDSPYQSFEERLAREDKFFNSDQFPAIAFKSTKVESSGPDKLLVTGDLTFLGQTRPLTLDAAVTGSMDKHPFTGVGAVGFSATTTFTRSEWGMTGTQQFLGDEVTIQFDGEFQQADAAPAS